MSDGFIPDHGGYTIDLTAFYDAICRGDTWETLPHQNSWLWGTHPYYQELRKQEQTERRRWRKECLRAKREAAQKKK
jgi:hypothetical protein